MSWLPYSDAVIAEMMKRNIWCMCAQTPSEDVLFLYFKPGTDLQDFPTEVEGVAIVTVCLDAKELDKKELATQDFKDLLELVEGGWAYD